MVGKIVRIKGDVNTKYVKIKEIVEEGVKILGDAMHSLMKK